MTAVRSTFLRTVLALDAAACGIGGAAMVLDSTALEGPLGLGSALLRGGGAFILAEAALLAWLASRPSLPRAVVWSLVGLNILWAVESAMALMFGWLRPTGAGEAVVLVQAVGALIVADLQYLALRRSRAAA